MKAGWILVAAGVLAACGQEVEAPAEYEEPVVEAPDTFETPAEIAKSDVDTDYLTLSGYGDDWYVSPGWPGEYPAGFVVLDAGVTVKGHALPNPATPADVSCPLPQYANYQLWNHTRVESDNLDFFVATKIVPVVMSQDASIEYVSDDGIQTLELKAGDQLNYLRYMGEGFAIMSFNGQQYDVNESDLREISDIGGINMLEAQWVRVTCQGGGRAWLMYNETVDLPGIAPSPITGYGDATDLAPEDVESVRADASANRAAYEGIAPDEIPDD